MNKLPKIPSPFSHYVREFRHSVMPVVVFFLVLLLAINLWNKHVAPPSIVGQAEMVRSSVTTTLHGEIVEMHVDLLQRVEKGDPIATVVSLEDDVMNASINAAQADLLTLRARLQQDNMRILENFERLKHEVAVRKVERATENVNLQYAIKEYQRVAKLFQDKMVSESEYDLARAAMEALKEKVAELDRLILESEASLARIKPPADPHFINTNDPIVQAIAASEGLIKAQFKPLIIRAPMSGAISAVYKRKGEKVVRGDAIVVISTLEPERILGYVRQPLNLHPKVGDPVEVRARSFNRLSAKARIMKVGTQLELIPFELLPLAVQNHATEYGLPVLITLPKELQLMPGEIVDISVAAITP